MNNSAKIKKRTPDQMFNRVGKVRLYSNDVEDKLNVYFDSGVENGLDFKFHFEISSNDEKGVVGQGSVGVLGLNGDTIRRLVTFGCQEDEQNKQRFIEVFAGYEKDGPVDQLGVFKLPVYGANFTQPPDMWLNIEGYTEATALSDYSVENHKSAVEQIRENSRNIKFKEGCEYFIKLCNTKMEWWINPDQEKCLPKYFPNFIDFNPVNVMDVVKFLNSLGLIKARYYAEGSVRNGSKEAFVAVMPTLALHNAAQDMKTEKEEGSEISVETGMIGIPQFQAFSGYAEVQVKTLLRRDLNCGDKIKVVSKYLSIPFKTYVITKISYDGQFRGQDWYTTYTAIAEGPFAHEKDKQKNPSNFVDTVADTRKAIA